MIGFDDLASRQGDHGAEAILEDQPAGGEAQPGGQDAVVGAGRPAALEVPQDDAARLEPGLLLDGFGDHAADAAQAQDCRTDRGDRRA